MIDSGRPSLFAVLSPMDLRSPHFCSILQLQPNDHRASAAPELLPVHLDEKKDYVVHFTYDFKLYPKQVPPPMTWMCSSTKDEFFMVPFLTSDAYQLDVPPLYGLEYNFRTHTYRQMDPPLSLRPYAGCAVNLAGLLYFIAQPYAPFDLQQPKPCIQRYDPVRRSWKTLAPFPMPSNTDIKATAVWYDNILFNMVGPRRAMWAFNVTENKWYPVIVQDEDNLCYHIVGEAVVRENTIYALKDDPCNSVLALSFQRVENNGGILYTCSLLCEIPVLGMRSISSLCGSATRETRYLVHLGQGNFCLVQSCERTCTPAVNQPVQVTYMKLEGNNSMIVTDNCVYEFPIEGGVQFRVLLCFSLPEYKTLSAKNLGEGYLFSPFPWDYDIDLFDTEYFKLRNAEFGIPSHGYAPKASTLGDGRLTSKRLKTVGEDTWTPEIHLQEHVPEKSSASSFERGKTVGEGSNSKYQEGRPFSSYPLEERVMIPKGEICIIEGEIDDYVSSAIRLLRQRKEIVLKAQGVLISKAVFIAEEIKKFLRVHQDTATGLEIITDDTGKDVRPAKISITLSTQELNKGSPGNAMDRCQKVEKPKAESPTNEHELHITEYGHVLNYSSQAVHLLCQGRSRKVVLIGMGWSVSKTVGMAELIKMKVPQLHQDNATSTKSKTNDAGQPRRVAMISISLSAKDSPGPYNSQQQPQPPRPIRSIYSLGNRKRGQDRWRAQGWDRGGYSDY